jgi:hypothetical protein
MLQWGLPDDATSASKRHTSTLAPGRSKSGVATHSIPTRAESASALWRIASLSRDVAKASVKVAQDSR